RVVEARLLPADPAVRHAVAVEREDERLVHVAGIVVQQILPSLPMLCNAQKNKGLRIAAPAGVDALLVDGFLEALPRGEGRDGLGGNLDLLAAGGAAPGPRLSLSRQEGAEADDGDALAARDVGDDRVEHRVDRLARRRFAEIA